MTGSAPMSRTIRVAHGLRPLDACQKYSRPRAQSFALHRDDWAADSQSSACASSEANLLVNEAATESMGELARCTCTSELRRQPFWSVCRRRTSVRSMRALRVAAGRAQARAWAACWRSDASRLKRRGPLLVRLVRGEGEARLSRGRGDPSGGRGGGEKGASTITSWGVRLN